MAERERQRLTQVDIFDLWSIAWSYKWLIGGVTIAFAVFSVFYALSLANIYRAETVLVPAEASARGNLSSITDQLAGFGGFAVRGTADTTEEALAILRSRAFTERFISEHSLLAQLFPEQWDDESGWLLPPDERPTLWDGYRVLSQIRTINYDRSTRLVTVSIDWPDPVLAAQWVNSMVIDLNTTVQDRAIREAQANRSFLEQQIETTSVVGMRQVLYNLLENEIQTLMLANGRPEYAFKAVGPALPPEQRVRPSRAIVCISITLAGGVLAVLLAFVRYGYRQRLESRAVSSEI